MRIYKLTVKFNSKVLFELEVNESNAHRAINALRKKPESFINMLNEHGFLAVKCVGVSFVFEYSHDED